MTVRKWILILTFAMLVLTACSNGERASEKANENEPIVNSEKKKTPKEPSNLLEELQLQLPNLLLPQLSTADYLFHSIDILYKEDGTISGSLTLKKNDQAFIDISFYSLDHPELKDSLRELEEGKYYYDDNGDGLAFVHNGFAYEYMSRQLLRGELTQLSKTFSNKSYYHQFIEVDTDNYVWPDFLPYGEPESVRVSYYNRDNSNNFNLSNQAVQYSNSKVNLWEYNQFEHSLRPMHLTSIDLFLKVDDAMAYYSEHDESSAMIVDMGNSKFYSIQPISEVYGEHAHVYFPKPDNYEEELEKLFIKLAEHNGYSVASIQKGMTSNGVTTAGAEREQLEVIDRAFYIYGITIGTTKEEVEALHGIAPTIRYYDSKHSDFMAYYPEIDLSVGYKINEQGQFIANEVLSRMEGDQYHIVINYYYIEHDPIRDINNSDISYFLYEETNQLVKLVPYPQQREYSIHLHAPDLDFYQQYAGIYR